MQQAIYGLVLFVFLILPPVANLLESVMTIHMHMQMPLLVIAGMMMAPYVQQRFPGFFKKWNSNGIPGILLVIIIWSYWMLPRAMDDALTMQTVEIFKFISLPFLVGIPLRESWKKIGTFAQHFVYIYFVISSIIMGWIYIASESQLCNNYLIIEQKTLGWAFITVAACVLIYYVQILFIKESDYE
ncbi:hypothetical protein ACFQ3N_11505 [Virgibacillus byunsanensis]|uniref:Uncharacterized protein n=1 Tax=Virgibacillus byunsanensis TaxID=570945 RepID=A0ABW3LQ16_9BACI